MNEQLIKFIELCLTDGVITDKEREVIFRKAAEYNVDIDECEIILESMIQQKNMSKTVTILKNEIVTEVNTEINNSEKNSSLLSIYSNIYDLYSDDKYLECINEVKKAESLFKDLFKDSNTAIHYLWSLMKVDVEKAYEEIDRVTNIVEDKSSLQQVIGLIYQEKGTKTNDLTILNKALHWFKSCDSDSYYEEKIEYVQEIINRIVSNSNKELEAKNSNLENKSSTLNEYKFVSRTVTDYYPKMTIYRYEIKITNNYISCSKMFATTIYDSKGNTKIVFDILDSETIIFIKNYTKIEVKNRIPNYADIKIIGKNAKNIIEGSDFEIEDVNKIRVLITKLI